MSQFNTHFTCWKFVLLLSAVRCLHLMVALYIFARVTGAMDSTAMFQTLAGGC